MALHLYIINEFLDLWLSFMPIDDCIGHFSRWGSEMIRLGYLQLPSIDKWHIVKVYVRVVFMRNACQVDYKVSS